jgi:hypothetical protein
MNEFCLSVDDLFALGMSGGCFGVLCIPFVRLPLDNVSCYSAMSERGAAKRSDSCSD